MARKAKANKKSAKKQAPKRAKPSGAIEDRDVERVAGGGVQMQDIHFTQGVNKSSNNL